MGILWLFSLIAIVLTLLLVFRKKCSNPQKYDLWVIRGAALFVWGWEIIKGAYMIRSDLYGGVGNYPAFMLPFHICSMALYAYVVIGFHPGKLSKFITPFAYSTLFLMTMIILTIPASSGILGNIPNWRFVAENTLPFQSFLYHGTLVFVPLYMVMSGFYRPTIRDTGKAMATLAATALFAYVVNKVLLTTDFMTLERGIGNPFAFLIEVHYLLYLLVLATISAAGTFLMLLVSELLVKKNIEKSKTTG